MMVMTREELVASLQHEDRTLVHPAGKVDKAKLDYRPTPKQRSTLELLQYMAIMGPIQISVIKAGGFTRAALSAVWSPAEAAAKAMNFDHAVSAIQKQSDDYARLLSQWTESDFRSEVHLFGTKTTCGNLLVELVPCGHAAYRTQLFCYLKSCGREELSTINLWAGVDGRS